MIKLSKDIIENIVEAYTLLGPEISKDKYREFITEHLGAYLSIPKEGCDIEKLTEKLSDIGVVRKQEAKQPIEKIDTAILSKEIEMFVDMRGDKKEYVIADAVIVNNFSYKLNELAEAVNYLLSKQNDE